MTTELYPKIAEEFSTSTDSVESAISHAIKKAWKCGCDNIKNQGFYEYRKPTNSQFIMTAVEILRIEDAKEYS